MQASCTSRSVHKHACVSLHIRIRLCMVARLYTQLLRDGPAVKIHSMLIVAVCLQTVQIQVFLPVTTVTVPHNTHFASDVPNSIVSLRCTPNRCKQTTSCAALWTTTVCTLRPGQQQKQLQQYIPIYRHLLVLQPFDWPGLPSLCLLRIRP